MTEGSLSAYFPDCVTHTSNQASIYMHACMLSRFSCVRLCVTPWTIAPPGSSVYGDSSGKTTRVGCHALLQGIFLSQRSNLLCLLHGQVGSLPLAPAGKPPHLHTYSQLSAVADECYSCLQCFPLPSPCFVHSSRAKIKPRPPP